MPRSHYDVLQLPQSSNLHPDAVRAAYRAALLTYHPDRKASATPAEEHRQQQQQHSQDLLPTIDEIVLAYKVLSDDKLRAEYDHAQALLAAARQQQEHRLGLSSVEHAGIESYDLEDLSYDSSGEDGDGRGGTWLRSCRCGKERGYVVTEADLEAADQQQQQQHGHGHGHGQEPFRDRGVQEKEVLVGCQGCSLVIRVTFATEPG